MVDVGQELGDKEEDKRSHWVRFAHSLAWLYLFFCEYLSFVVNKARPKVYEKTPLDHLLSEDQNFADFQDL